MNIHLLCLIKWFPLSFLFSLIIIKSSFVDVFFWTTYNFSIIADPEYLFVKNKKNRLNDFISNDFDHTRMAFKLLSHDVTESQQNASLFGYTFQGQTFPNLWSRLLKKTEQNFYFLLCTDDVSCAPVKGLQQSPRPFNMILKPICLTQPCSELVVEWPIVHHMSSLRGSEGWERSVKPEKKGLKKREIHKPASDVRATGLVFWSHIDHLFINSMISVRQAKINFITTSKHSSHYLVWNYCSRLHGGSPVIVVEHDEPAITTAKRHLVVSIIPPILEITAPGCIPEGHHVSTRINTTINSTFWSHNHYPDTMTPIIDHFSLVLWREFYLFPIVSKTIIALTLFQKSLL